MPSDELLVRSLAPGELAQVIEWAAAEGWNPGDHDVDTFTAVDPHGFFGAERDGRLVGAISAVRHSPSYGFLGLYLVPPELRGQGIGTALWARALVRLDAMATDRSVVGLDGVLERVDDYTRSGFVAAHRNVRFQGPASAWEVSPPVGLEVVAAGGVDVEHHVALDARSNPAPRAGYLRAWLAQPGAHTAAVLGPDGRTAGLAVARPARDGWRVGPLLAPSPSVAEALMGAVVGGLAPDTPVAVDVPEVNDEATALVSDRGLEPTFECVRMYRGGRPEPDLATCYGVTTLELG